MVESGRWPAPGCPAGAWYFAQRVERDRVPAPDVSDDDRRAGAIVGGSAARRQAAERRAFAHLEKHWHAVRDLADALLAQGELNGAEIEALLEVHGVVRPTLRGQATRAA
jgi:hypothetical protein